MLTSEQDDLFKSISQRMQHFRLTPAQCQPKPEPDQAAEWRERNRPLVDRLRDLLATIPPEVIAEGLSLRDLQARLKGRQKKTCHAGELSAALRQLGYERHRGWREGRSGFCSRWFPADTTK